MSFNHRQLIAFVTVAQCQSLGRAARELNFTQPGLSRVIKNLEAAVGVKLFDRHAHGMSLTAYGSVFLPHAQSVLSSYERSIEAIREMATSGRGPLRVGVVGSVAKLLLPEVLAEMLRLQPNLRIDLVEDIEDRLAQALLSSRIDFAVAGNMELSDEIHLEPEPLMNDEWWVMANAENPLSRRAAVELRELSDCSWILAPPDSLAYRQVSDFFRSHGLPVPETSIHTRSVTAVRALVSSGPYLCFMPESLMRAELEAGLVKRIAAPQAIWKRSLYIYRRKSGVLPATALQSMKLLRDVARRAT